MTTLVYLSVLRAFQHLVEMSALHLVIMMLATWRLTNLLVIETGPGAVLEKARSLARWILGDGDGSLYQLMNCHYCMSVWVGTLVSMVYLFAPLPSLVIAMPLAISGASCFLQQMTFDKMPTGKPDDELPTGPPPDQLWDD